MQFGSELVGSELVGSELVGSELVGSELGDELAKRAGAERIALATLIAVIAGSPIVVTGSSAGRVTPRRDVPAGFDAFDVAVLDWIVAEGRRLCRRRVLM